jgi:hypothetical protein
MITEEEYQSIKLVNCANCDAELIGSSQAAWYYALPQADRDHRPPLMYTRVNQRPFCRECCIPINRPVNGGRGPREDAGPSWDNAVRCYEEDR